VGRWVERDPLEYIDGSLMYIFVDNKPLEGHDSHGLSAIYKRERIQTLSNCDPWKAKIGRGRQSQTEAFLYTTSLRELVIPWGRRTGVLTGPEGTTFTKTTGSRGGIQIATTDSGKWRPISDASAYDQSTWPEGGLCRVKVSYKINCSRTCDSCTEARATDMHTGEVLYSASANTGKVTQSCELTAEKYFYGTLKNMQYPIPTIGQSGGGVQAGYQYQYCDFSKSNEKPSSFKSTLSGRDCERNCNNKTRSVEHFSPLIIRD